MQSSRSPSLDALRAGMMLLGLVVHGGAAYLVHASPERWPYADPARSLFFDVALYVIHIFRMPVFFLLAGYFATRVWQSRGLEALVRSRVRRILLPLLLFFVPVALADVASFAYCTSGRDWRVVESALLAYRFEGEVLGHLWFLSHLVWIGALLALLLWRAPRRTTALLERLATRRGLALSALLLALILFGEPYGVLRPKAFLLPTLGPLVANALFFAHGSALALVPDWRTRLAAVTPRLALAALALLAVSFATLYAFEEAGTAEQLPAGPQAFVAAVSALTIGMSTLAWVGLALRVRLPSWPWLRELADASYWIYLAHHALIVFAVGALGPLALPALLKWAMAAALTLAACLLSYRVLVKGRWLGTLVGGAGALNRSSRSPSAAPP